MSTNFSTLYRSLLFYMPIFGAKQWQGLLTLIIVKHFCMCQLATELECRTSVRDISDRYNGAYFLSFIPSLLIYCISQCMCLFSPFTLMYYCLFFCSFLFCIVSSSISSRLFVYHYHLRFIFLFFAFVC